MAIHLGYKLAQAMAYSRGAFTVVYPVVRGTGPLVTVLAAGVVFGSATARCVGAECCSCRAASSRCRRSTCAAPGGRGSPRRSAGRWSRAYSSRPTPPTTPGASGATPDAFTFLAWFFLLDGLIFPWIAAARWLGLHAPPALPPLLARGVTGGLVAYVSFGSIMLATRIDKVGQAAVLRETSVVFAALIGWAVLGERVGALRAALVVLIVAGAIVMEFGGG